MPEQHPHLQFRRPPRHLSRPSSLAPRPSFAELNCYTNFSFLRGASHPDELVLRAAELGYKALAITDHNSLAGVVRAHTAAKEVGLKLLIGAQVTPIDGPPLVLLATDRPSYGRLANLLSSGKLRAPKGECELCMDDIASGANGLLAGIPLQISNCKLQNERLTFAISGQQSAVSDQVNLQSEICNLKSIFGDRLYALAQLHRGPNDRAELQQMRQFAKKLRIPLAASNGVLYHHPRRQFLHNVLTAIREKCTVAELDHRLHPNAERHLKSPQQMAELFADCPEAIARTVEIADRCRFSLDELRYEYPHELSPEGMTPLEYFKKLTWQGAKQRYPQGVPDKVLRIIRHEMQLIEELHYEAYFLTVWDIVRFARSRNILCQGRGSAANSAVCFCLGVTSVDPDRIDVLFERFVSAERDEAPDIDIDFEHERREEVLQYIYEKYGRDRAGMTAEVITYRIRSAVREVSKALGLSLDQVDRLSKVQEHYYEDDKLGGRFAEAGLDPKSRAGRQLTYLVRELLGFPRHLSQHVGGMVITEGLLRELVPIENARMPDRTVIEWDKDDIEALGILKVDCLGLGMLTAIRKCFAMIEENHGQKWSLSNVPAEDPNVYKMIQRADTMGVFQIESRAQMSMLPRLKPECFYDLVIEIAIVRPGPIQGDMVHPYLRRRSGLEPVEYPDERVKAVLHKTLGVPLFQEQAMKLAVVAAGFTPGEADQLRRAMGAWRKRGVIDKFRKKLIDGMQKNGYNRDFAERVFKQIRGFGEYGFPESHSASFALLVYISSWMKCYYHSEFTAAIINSQPMGFYQPAQLIADARKHGVIVYPVDVNASDWNCKARDKGRGARGEKIECRTDFQIRPNGETDGLRNPSYKVAGDLSSPLAPRPSPLAPRLSPSPLILGLRLVRGLSEAEGVRVVQCRAEGLFTSFADFAKRTGFGSGTLTKLAQADAFRSLDVDRRPALWMSFADTEPTPLFADQEHEEASVTLPAMPDHQSVMHDYQHIGLSLRGHPMQFLREQLENMGVTPAKSLAHLPNDRPVKVAGIVLLRQRPSTAKGVTFVTLEDETGFANLIIRPEVWERFHTIAKSAAVMMASGRLQREGQVIHVLTTWVGNLTTMLGDRPQRSRDFR